MAFAAAPSFRHEVMPVLSRAGCNLGTCHGNLNGKGGFKLSLRGEDPDWDYRRITREQLGRRTDRIEPDRSLILLKGTAALAHEGGKRFNRDAQEYAILRQWIAAGQPMDSKSAPDLVGIQVTPVRQVLVEPAASVEIRVEARFSDGATRDVTHLTTFETPAQIASVSREGRVQRLEFGETVVLARYQNLQKPVTVAFVPKRPDFVWSDPKPFNFIDGPVFEKLKTLRMNPSEVCDDSVYVRRVFLDLIGRIPTVEEARTFVADGRADKRDQLVVGLLGREDFSDFWALKWSDLLRNEEKVLDRKGVENFHRWIRDSIAANKPMDVFARELIASRGSTYQHPEANYYRALREPEIRAEATAQVFLGTRLQCAKCHNHPFERWTMDDYYGFTANFARVQYEIVENRRRDSNDKNQFIGEQIVWMDREGEVKDPRHGAVVKPRFLGTEHQASGPQDRLESLAAWLTAEDNELFAQVMANRIWSQLMGRGIVEPIDDFRATNPPANPVLLEAITRDFVKSGMDMRHLIRRICASRVYQLSTLPHETNREDENNFARAQIRRLSAEQMLDSMSTFAGVPLGFNGFPAGTRAAQISGVNAVYRDSQPSAGDRFIKLFGKPMRLQNCTCERSDETALGQVFELTSGDAVNTLLTAEHNRISALLDRRASDSEIVDELYWAALSRSPVEKEREATVAYLASAKDRRRAAEDIAWGLVNAKEFILRR